MGVAGFAGHALAHGDAHIVDAAVAGGGVYGDRLADRGFRARARPALRCARCTAAPYRCSSWCGPDGQGLEQRVAPARDGGDMKHRIDLDPRNSPRNSPLGPSASCILPRPDRPSSTHRHRPEPDVVADALGQRHRGATQAGRSESSSPGIPHGGAENNRPVAARHHAERQDAPPRLSAAR